MQCKKCNKGFAAGEALAMHYKDAHPEVAPEDRKSKAASIALLSKHKKSLAVVAVLLIVVGIAVFYKPNASNVSGNLAPVIDGVPCTALEGTVMHIHPHLNITLDNRAATVPADIGILGNCLYSLHTHDASGTIHVESSVVENFTLGQFLDIWNATQAYSSTFIPSKTYSNITAYINGSIYRGNYKNIVLNDREEIRLVVQS